MGGRESLRSVRDAFHEAVHGTTSYARRVINRKRLVPVDSRDEGILGLLNVNGACSSSLATLDTPGTAALLQNSDRLFDEMARLNPKEGNKDYMIAAEPALITNYPDILRWGLNERFLAIAENYIGMPIAYRGVLARLDMPDGTVRETRLWHLDQEDSRILKIVVYVSDVDDDGGPFEYVPASHGQPLHLVEGSKKRVNNEHAFDLAVPAERRGAIVGPRGTVGFVDTCRILHRGRMPVNGTRKSLFFAYNSQWPTRPSHCEPMFLVEKFKGLAGALTPRQSAALNFGYC
jgi:hypothetical protein